jgi:hypothetical protein
MHRRHLHIDQHLVLPGGYTTQRHAELHQALVDGAQVRIRRCPRHTSNRFSTTRSNGGKHLLEFLWGIFEEETLL